MPVLSALVPGDQVEIIAPAFTCTMAQLDQLKDTLESWQLKCHIDPHILGEDLLCANSDINRFKALQRSLLSPDNKAVICARGGYGSMRLLPWLAALPRPAQWKWFVGMSDITSLHLYLNQRWQWPTVHGTISNNGASLESIQAVKSILFGEVSELNFTAQPYNTAAFQTSLIKAPIVGGNLCLVQASLGTFSEIKGKNKIVFLEEVNERGYCIDRMLEQLKQSGLFDDAAAVLLGDFIGGDEQNGASLVEPVLKRFAAECSIPVIRVQGLGHGINKPFCLGVCATLQLQVNEKTTLIIPCR